MTGSNDAAREHQQDYEAAIDQWEQVLAWSNQHGDRKHAEIATKKLESLRKRFAAATLSKLEREDQFEALFDRPPIEKNPLAQTILGQMERELGPSQLPPVDLSSIKPFLDWQDGSPGRIKKEIWGDRLKVQKRTRTEPSGGKVGNTTKKTKEKRGVWAHTSPPPPADVRWWQPFIEDSLKGLAKAIGATDGVIRGRNQRGTLWVMFVQGKKFRVWFQNKLEYETAKARHDNAKATPEAASQENGTKEA